MNLSNQEFRDRARAVVRGLGMSGARTYAAEGMDCAFRKSITRESTDGMFRSEESWLVVFCRSRKPLAGRRAEQIVDGVIGADVRYALIVFCGEAACTQPETAAGALLDELVQRGLLREVIRQQAEELGYV